MPYFVLSELAARGSGSLQVFETYRGSLFPPDAFLANGTRIGNILMFVVPFFPSVAIGLITGNFVVWSISPARRAFRREAEGVKGERFRSAQLGLVKAGTVLAAIGLPLCLLGANNTWALTPNGIDYRPMLSTAARHYAWSSVERIETGCSPTKNGIDYHFVVTLNDKTHIDLMEESRDEFLAAYPRIQSALSGHGHKFDDWVLGLSCRPRPALQRVLSQRPNP